MSIMSEKSLACGEGGVLVTNDAEIYERAVAFGHYERTPELELHEVKPFVGMPLGGYKYRMHQLSSAVGRVQLRHYKSRMEEIQRAMNYFWDLLEGVPGLKAHRPPSKSGNTMGGWYAAHGLYAPESGLPVANFCEAVTRHQAPFPAEIISLEVARVACLALQEAVASGAPAEKHWQGAAVRLTETRMA